MPEPGSAPGLVDVARRWAETLADTKGVSLPKEQLEQLLLGVAKDAVRAEPDHQPAVRRFSKLYSASPIGIALADPHGTIVEANVALGTLLGCRPATLRGREIPDLGSADHDVARLRNALSQLMTAGRPTQQERLLLDHSEEGPLWVDVTLTDLPGDRPGSTYPVLMVADANEIHLLQEQLLHQNVHDPLTGLPNATAFGNALEAALAGSGSEQIALVYLDVDGFKVINDGLGEAQGRIALEVPKDGVALRRRETFGVVVSGLAGLAAFGAAVTDGAWPTRWYRVLAALDPLAHVANGGRGDARRACDRAQ